MKADEVDRPTAARIRDLKERGMWDDTLIVWGGEFGRTPMAQGKGRDHHIKGFSIVLAGGGGAGAADSPMARPMNSGTPRWKTRCPCMTCTRRCSRPLRHRSARA
jgi:uncharacterized protein (DUF1501 family)